MRKREKAGRKRYRNLGRNRMHRRSKECGFVEGNK